VSSTRDYTVEPGFLVATQLRNSPDDLMPITPAALMSASSTSPVYQEIRRFFYSKYNLIVLRPDELSELLPAETAETTDTKKVNRVGKAFLTCH